MNPFSPFVGAFAGFSGTRKILLVICVFVFVSTWGARAQEQSRSIRYPSERPAAVSTEVGIGDLYAVVVGVSNYSNPKIPKLSLADKDARDFANFLNSQKNLFRKTHLKLLINEKATQTEVKKQLFYELRQAGKNDTVVIFFAGHGADDPNMPGEFFFLTHDANPEYLEATAVNMSRTWFMQRLDSKRVVVVADTCHAGGLSSKGSRSIDSSLAKFMNQFNQAEGRFFISSCRPDEISKEDPSLGNGVFTHYLLEGLRGKADANGDGVVTLQEAYEYVYEKAKDFTKGGQHAKMSSQAEGAFPMALSGVPDGASSVIHAECPSLINAISLKKVGERLLERSEFHEAVDVFNQMLSNCCQDEYYTAVSRFCLAKSYLDLGNFDKAMEFANSAEAAFSQLNKPVETAKALHLKARIYSGTTDYEKAFRNFASAEEILSGAGRRDESELFWLLANRAQAYIYLSNYDAANKDLDAAQKLLRGDKDPAKVALLSEHRGLILAEQQYYDKAQKEYQEALQYYQTNHNLKGMSAVLRKIGHISECKSEYEPAQKYYQDSLNLARDFGDPSSQAFALNNLGNVYAKRGSYEEAVRMLDEALKIRSELGIGVFYGETLNNRGVVDIYYGKYPDALKRFTEAYRLAKIANSPAGQAWAMHNMAWVLKEQGNLKDAQSYSQLAIELARQIHNRRLEATAVLTLGNLYESYGDFDGALKQYELSAKIQREIGDRQFLSNTLFDMANVDTRTDNAGKAENEYRESIQLKKQIGVPLGEVLCKFALFHMEKDSYAPDGDVPDGGRQSDLKLAGDYIKQAENTIRPDEENDLMLLSYVKGRYLLEQDPAAALKEFSNLASQADAAGSLRMSFLASVGQGLSYEKLKNLPDAEKAFEKAVNWAEAIRNTLDPVTKRTFLEGEEILGAKHILPYQDLARVRLKMGNWSESLEAAEYIKVRSFADRMVKSAADIDSRVDKKLLADLDLAEEQMASTYRRLQDCLARGGDATVVPAVLQRHRELDAQLEQIKKSLAQKFPDYYAVRFPSPVSTEKSALKPDEIAIAYEVTDPGLLIYLIKGKSIVHAEYREVPKNELDAMVSKFLKPFEGLTSENVFQKLKSFDLAMGKKLYDLLLGGVLRKTEARKPVIIIPDGSLTILPFEMLVADNGGKIDLSGDLPSVTGTRFFADRNTMSYSQSLTALTLARGLKKRKKGSHDRVLVIANPVIGAPAGDAALAADVSKERAAAIDEVPGTKVLAEDLQKTFGDRCDVYSGKDATMDIFVNQIAPKIGIYDKIVFATHGYFGDGLLPEIQEPVLMLSLIPARADNLLKMSSVMNLDVNADIVVLLADQTGVGKYVAGEGTLSMGRAFQYAGARSVLMSLGLIAEDSSVKLVSSFLKHLNEGKTKLEALQMARTELRSQGFDHPFFWASFILSGEAN